MTSNGVKSVTVLMQKRTPDAMPADQLTLNLSLKRSSRKKLISMLTTTIMNLKKFM
jgi:hypothetical protein